MKHFVLALAATFAATCAFSGVVVPTSAYAQDGGAAPAAAAPEEGGGGEAGAGGGKMKEMVKACRKEAKAAGTKAGHDLNQAIADCVVKQKPKAAARMQCRVEGLDKGLKPGDELKTFIKDCVKQKHGA